MSSTTRPPYDAELIAGLAVIPAQVRATLTPENLAEQTAHSTTIMETAEQMVAGRPIEAIELTIPGYQGVEIAATVFHRTSRIAETSKGRPGLFHMHGGGMVAGHRLMGAEMLLPWIEEYDAVAVTVEYRLAPAYPYPVPVEDCYAGLVWFVSQAEKLGFDPSRIMVVGASAGGGLAAGVTLLARDRGGPAIAWQMLMYPMLDDRDATISSQQFDEEGIVWNKTTNRTGWGAYLGERRGGADVSIYAAPARATDLSNLPPTWLDVGSAEVFRDEVVAYASGIWAAGGRADLQYVPSRLPVILVQDANIGAAVSGLVAFMPSG